MHRIRNNLGLVTCLFLLARETECYIGQFGDMIRYATQREALYYNAYGNYCGIQMSTLTPVDEVDSCCQVHDACYITTNNGVCSNSWLRASFIYYDWTWNGTNITCNDTDTCYLTVCQCDKAAAECFARHPYNINHKKSSIFDSMSWMAPDLGQEF